DLAAMDLGYAHRDIPLCAFLCALCSPLCPRRRGAVGDALASATAPIGFSFEPQRLIRQRTDERLVIDRDDDNAAVGDGMAPATPAADTSAAATPDRTG